MTVATEPTCLHALLSELGVKQASVDKQLPVLRAWLTTHNASRQLRISMCCNRLWTSAQGVVRPS